MSLHPGTHWEASQAQSDKANRVSSRKGVQDWACEVFLGSQKFPQLSSKENPNLRVWPRGDLLDPVD